jgi:hypothetical protein
VLLRLGGGHELLCNNCGLEFKAFKWAADFERAPGKVKSSMGNRRRAPRYSVHLPTTIRLVKRNAQGELLYSLPVRGHCQTISSLGMALSFVGSRIDPSEFKNTGRHLQVVISLPSGALQAVVKTVTHDRTESAEGLANWFIGSSIVQISDADRERLLSYLEKRSRE